MARPRYPTRRAALAVVGIAVAAVLFALVTPRSVPLRSRVGTSRPAELSREGEESRLRQAAESQPNAAAARQAFGQHYLDHGRPFSALWELWAALRLDPGPSLVRVQVAVALASGLLYDSAIEQLESLVADRPGEREGRIQLSTLYLATMRPERGAAPLLGAPDPEHWAEGQLALGKVYQVMGRARLAGEAYARARALTPSLQEATYRLARLALLQGETDRALSILEKTFGDTGLTARSMTLLAQSYAPDLFPAGPSVLSPRSPGGAAPARRGPDLAKADQWLEEALKLDPGFVPAWVATGRLRTRQRRLQEARRAYEEALSRSPGDAEVGGALAGLLTQTGRAAQARAVRARSYRARGLPARAVQEYAALSHFPEQELFACMEMSLVLLQMQQKARAVQVAEAALARHSREPALYERLVVLELARFNRARARRWCEELRRLQPDSGAPHWLMARVAADSGDRARGAALLEDLLKAEPDNLTYAVTLAEILLRDPQPQQLQRARALLERAVSRPPVESKTHLHLGTVLLRLGEADAARRELLHALDQDPNLAPPYVNLVQAARRLRDPEQVRFWAALVPVVEERLRTELLLSRRTWDHPDDPVGYRDLAQHLIRNADLAKAESQLEEASRLRPGWAEVRRQLDSVRRVLEVL